MRIQLELPESRVQELKSLMDEAGVETYKELFNNALTLLDWAVEQARDGKAIASVDEETDKHRVLLMPFLENIARRRRTSAVAAGAR